MQVICSPFSPAALPNVTLKFFSYSTTANVGGTIDPGMYQKACSIPVTGSTFAARALRMSVTFTSHLRPDVAVDQRPIVRVRRGDPDQPHVTGARNTPRGVFPLE